MHILTLFRCNQNKSWSYDESTINLTKREEHGPQDSLFINNSQWILQEVISYSESLPYNVVEGHGDKRHPFVIFEIHLKRRALFFIFNYFFPCVLILFTCLMGFIMSPENSRKMDFGTWIIFTTFSSFLDKYRYISVNTHFTCIWFQEITVLISIICFSEVLLFFHDNRNLNQCLICVS